jgi:hypothetical protein
MLEDLNIPASLRKRIIVEDDGHWHFAGKRRNGVFQIRVGSSRSGGKRVTVPRFLYEAKNGPVGDARVFIVCGDRDCVCPDHAVHGTHREYYRERERRGTVPRGERNGRSLLDEETVRAIYMSREPTSYLVAMTGVARRTIELIKEQRTWAWATKDLPKPPAQKKFKGNSRRPR